MTEDIVHEATYPHPPEAVWRAIATPEGLNAWLMPNTFREATVGHRFQFRDKPRKVVGWDGITDCEVLEATPPRRFAFTFESGDDVRTRVEWTLEPVAGGTRVRFRHTGFTGFKGWMMRAGMNGGWRGMVAHSIPFVVRGMLDGRTPTREETEAVRKRGARGDHAATKASA